MHFRPYTIALAVIYSLLLPIVYFFDPSLFDYSVRAEYLPIAVAILFASALSLYVACRVMRDTTTQARSRPSVRSIALALGYIAMISIAEELLFRGIIQGYFQTVIANTVLVVLFSSLLFGVAHLPNDAKGIHPLRWNWRLAGIAFLGGIPLGALYALTGSLLFPILLHAIFLLILKFTTPQFFQ